MDALTMMTRAAVLLAIGALGGLLMAILRSIVGVSLNLMYHAKLRPLPKQVIVIHGCVAVVAFILLLMAIMQPR